MIRILLALLMLCLAAAPTLAQEEPVEVTADNFVVDEPSRNATFNGNVVIKRGDLTLWAERVVVTYGEGGVEDIQTFDAFGGVRIRTPGQTASSSRAVFDPHTQLLTMSGNVEVDNAVGNVQGPQLVIDLDNNNSVFTGGGGGGRVTGVFTPQ